MILGCGLIVYVCVLSDEFGPRQSDKGSTTASSSSGQSTHVSYHTLNNGQNVVVTAQYSYGWSFFLAILGFLGAEFSAALCLTAFLNRFDSEVNFFKKKWANPGLFFAYFRSFQTNLNTIFTSIQCEKCQFHPVYGARNFDSNIVILLRAQYSCD